VTRRIYTTFSAVLLAATAGLAAANQAPGAPAQTPAAAPAEQQASADSPAYSYDPEGRRDPFVSLLNRGSVSPGSKTSGRPAGISGLEASEVVLKGTMQSPTGYVALVEATDKKTYIVKTGDRLLDGMVRTITGDTMVILQNVNDPLSLEKQREVRKTLRQTDEGK
jgi:Tfp pilus assembly protein PilP